MAKALTVLVTGATGKQGGALARALLNKGHDVRALTRHPESGAAQDLKRLGAELVAGNMEELSELERAVSGADAIFAVTDFWGSGADAEVRQGITVANAAKRAAVPHLVYTSVPKANEFTGIPHFDTKTRVEKYIIGLGVPYTIIGPAFFMENYLSPWWAPELQQGRFPLALKPNTKLQQIAVEDIGNFAALVIERRNEFLGERIDIGGDELTGPEIAQKLSRFVGRQIEYVHLPTEELKKFNEEFAIMFDWFENTGTGIDIAHLRRAYPEVGWHNFDQWAETQSWKTLKQPAA